MPDPTPQPRRKIQYQTIKKNRGKVGSLVHWYEDNTYSQALPKSLRKVRYDPGRNTVPGSLNKKPKRTPIQYNRKHPLL